MTRALVLVVAAASAAWAQPAPPLTGRVVDLADVLSPATESALEAALAAHEDSTSNQVVVLTISTLDGETLEPYATRVFREWGLGIKDRDNGVLLLVAVGDRNVRIEVGYGLEGVLTDATSGSIIRHEIVPQFRKSDFDSGVLNGATAVLDAIEGTYAPAPRPPRRARSRVQNAALAGLVAGLPILIGLTCITFWGGPGIGGALAALFFGLFPTGVFVLFATQLLWPSSLEGDPLRSLEKDLWSVAATMILFALVNLLAESSAWIGGWRKERRAKRRRFQTALSDARARGTSSFVYNGRTYSTARSSGGSGGRSSSSFSGGGGSSGGGGASGSW